MSKNMIKHAHHWGVCNTFELEVETGINEKYLYEMLKLLETNKLFGDDTEVTFAADPLDIEKFEEWQKKLTALKKKLMDKAKSDGKTDIFTNMLKKGFVPQGFIKSESTWGVEGSKDLEAFKSGKEEAAEVLQDATLIAFVNKKTGEVKILGQTGTDMSSGSEYAVDLDKKKIKPAIKKMVAAAFIAKVKESEGQVGVNYAITYDEQTGEVDAEAEITDDNFSDDIAPLYEEENQIQQKR